LYPKKYKYLHIYSGGPVGPISFCFVPNTIGPPLAPDLRLLLLYAPPFSKTTQWKLEEGFDSEMS
jgi:hypothetical protein